MLRKEEIVERLRKYKQPNHANSNAASRLPANTVSRYAALQFYPYEDTHATDMQLQVYVVIRMAH